MRALLGTGFTRGSSAANRILPGGSGARPHVDYPHWDEHLSLMHLARRDARFPLDAQATAALDPLTRLLR